MTPTGRRRLAIGLYALAVLGVDVAVVIDRTSTDPVSVDEAVERFRDEEAVVEDGDERPDPGVYVYATTGSESVGLPGGDHGYPAETTMTVVHATCGWRERWQPLEQRFDERTRCDGRLLHYTVHHEFFGQRDERTFTCTDDAVVVPAADAQPGDAWSSTCAGGGVTSARETTFVGDESIDVAGAPVATVHVRVDETPSGETTGTSTADWWFDERGLVVRYESSIETVADTVVGEVTYTEDVELVLTSLEPRR